MEAKDAESVESSDLIEYGSSQRIHSTFPAHSISVEILIVSGLNFNKF